MNEQHTTEWRGPRGSHWKFPLPRNFNYCLKFLLYSQTSPMGRGEWGWRGWGEFQQTLTEGWTGVQRLASVELTLPSPTPTWTACCKWREHQEAKYCSPKGTFSLNTATVIYNPGCGGQCLNASNCITLTRYQPIGVKVTKGAVYVEIHTPAC